MIQRYLLGFVNGFASLVSVHGSNGCAKKLHRRCVAEQRQLQSALKSCCGRLRVPDSLLLSFYRIPCNMSQMWGRALSEDISIFHKKSNMDKKCCSGKRFTVHSKYSNHYNKKDGEHKMKRLKTCKERSQMRGGWKETSKTKYHHHHNHCQSNVDMTLLHNCCYTSCHCSLRKSPLFPSVVPTAQEPSIITDSRLIGHHGLFNHEVKSVDIERLLSEQRKHGRNEMQVKEQSNAAHSSVPLSSDDLFGADMDPVTPFKIKTHPATKDHNNCREKEKKNLHFDTQTSDITPAQKPQKQFGLSSGSFKSTLSSKHSFFTTTTKTKNTDCVMSEEGRELLPTPTVDGDNAEAKTLNKKVKEHMISTLEETPKNQEPPVQQTQTDGLSPLKLISSPTDSCYIQERKQDYESVSKSVSAVAARLCDCLQFPCMRRRNLLSESREVLLKSLQERHGPWLQENLLRVQQHLSFAVHPTKKVQDDNQELTRINENSLFPQVWAMAALPEFVGLFIFNCYKGAASVLLRTLAHCAGTMLSSLSLPCYSSVCFSVPLPSLLNTQANTDTFVKIPVSTQFLWNISPQLHHSQKQAPQWLMSPVDASVNILDDILRPSISPQLYMDFKPSGASERNLFAPSTTLCQKEKASVLDDWGDCFKRSKNKRSFMFDSFENNLMNHTRAIRKLSPQYSESNMQPSFSYQAQLHNRHARKSVQFPQQEDPFGTDRCSCAPSFPAQIHHQSHHFQPLSQFSHPSTGPPLRSHYTDMIHYPPSYMLERDPATSLSALPSPEQWSFPPMRLY